MYLLKAQQQVAKHNLDTTIFLDGIAGTGKTTAAIERVKELIRQGADPASILVIVPQAALGVPYKEALRRSRVTGGGDIRTATLGRLAYEMVDLFYPLVADEFGVAKPDEPLHFLSLELVQYYMTRFVEPVIEQRDYFNSVTISRSRLYTQIVDNLNKAALVGFDHRTIAEKLKAAWRGDVSQEYIYDDAQDAAEIFRQVCHEHNMLDFSLQVTLFVDFLWEQPTVREYLIRQFRHLVIDNIEEETPAMHDLLHDWLPQCESAVVIYDRGGGYRRFLGADPQNALTLKRHCALHITLDNHRVMSPAMTALQVEMAHSLYQPPEQDLPDDADARDAIVYTDNRYHPQMIDWVTDNIAALIHQDGVSPGEIVVLAPYLPDALRFSLQTRLNERDIPSRTHRPSRALRDEPASRTLLTLAKVAHPQWGIVASKYDLAAALTASIADLDLVRARLLVDVLYRKDGLQPFGKIRNDAVQSRITFDLGTRYDRLLNWLNAYMTGDPQPLDGFFSTLFGEILSQPGFGFHENYDAATTAANLIDSAREFRQVVSKIEPELDTNPEYVRMVDNGVIANQYVREWATETRDQVLIAPAYTFLLSNLPVDYQFWLNVGSGGWAQRLHQPLTHPYVMSRQWDDGRVWTDQDELEADQQTLSYLALGLIRRCREKIYLGFSHYGEQGYEQRGPLLMTIQRMLRRLQKENPRNV